MPPILPFTSPSHDVTSLSAFWIYYFKDCNCSCFSEAETRPLEELFKVQFLWYMHTMPTWSKWRRKTGKTEVWGCPHSPSISAKLCVWDKPTYSSGNLINKTKEKWEREGKAKRGDGRGGVGGGGEGREKEGKLWPIQPEEKFISDLKLGNQFCSVHSSKHDCH